MRYLLDTNMCIYLTRGGFDHFASVRRRFAAMERGDAVISCLTYAELCHGVEKDVDARDARRLIVAQLVERIPILPFGREAAERFGYLAARTMRPLRNALDCMIAAHALALDLTLVTNNERDFAGFPGLVVENWAAN